MDKATISLAVVCILICIAMSVRSFGSGAMWNTMLHWVNSLRHCDRNMLVHECIIPFSSLTMMKEDPAHAWRRQQWRTVMQTPSVSICDELDAVLCPSPNDDDDSFRHSLLALQLNDCQVWRNRRPNKLHPLTIFIGYRCHICCLHSVAVRQSFKPGDEGSVTSQRMHERRGFQR